MAYFKQDGPMHGWNGPKGYTPAAPIERVLCDGCAKAEVPRQPHPVFPDATTHSRPWKWAPSFGGDCHGCGNRC